MTVSVDGERSARTVPASVKTVTVLMMNSAREAKNAKTVLALPVIAIVLTTHFVDEGRSVRTVPASLKTVTALMILSAVEVKNAKTVPA